MAKAAPKASAKAPHRLVRPAGRATTATLPPSPLQVGREVPADELGPAEVRGQHERLPHKPGQHDRRPQGLHAQAAAGALPADGLASPRAAAAHADGLSATASCASCPCPLSTSAAPRRGRCPRCGSSTATTGKAVSADYHRLAVNTANVMGRETFREFHRDSFRAHPLRHAARGRLGRHAAALSPRDFSPLNSSPCSLIHALDPFTSSMFMRWHRVVMACTQ